MPSARGAMSVSMSVLRAPTFIVGVIIQAMAGTLASVAIILTVARVVASVFVSVTIGIPVVAVAVVMSCLSALVAASIFFSLSALFPVVIPVGRSGTTVVMPVLLLSLWPFLLAFPVGLVRSQLLLELVQSVHPDEELQYGQK
jgi:hypothetical protein